MTPLLLGLRGALLKLKHAFVVELLSCDLFIESFILRSAFIGYFLLLYRNNKFTILIILSQLKMNFDYYKSEVLTIVKNTDENA